MKVNVNLDKSVSKETDWRLDDLRLVPDRDGIYRKKKSVQRKPMSSLPKVKWRHHETSANFLWVK